MESKAFVVGQDVYINGGVGLVWGKVVEVSPPCIYVEPDKEYCFPLRIRFNSDGKECGPDGVACTYENNIMAGPGPWELSLDGTAPPDSQYHAASWPLSPIDRNHPELTKWSEECFHIQASQNTKASH